jgi:predicted ribosome quality control (RQC) complex YloA/Tae2 family protein
MRLKPADFAALAAELTRDFAGARVQKAWSVARSVCVLQLKPRSGEPSLLLVRAGALYGRLSLLPERPALLEEPPQFQALLRRHLEGATLDKATFGGDRLQLRLSRGDAELTLIAVMDGAGALAVVEEGRVRALDAPRGAAPQDLLPGRELSPVQPALVEGSATAATLHSVEEAVGKDERAAASKAELQPLKSKLERTRRTLDKIRADLERANTAADFKQKGELLKPHLHLLKRGMKELTVDDWSADPPKKVTLPLDPKKTGSEQVAWFFHQARRLERGAEVAKERLKKLEAEAEALTLRLAEQPDTNRFVEVREAPDPGPRSSVPGPRPYREYTAHSGHKIRVGKGPRQNDELTLKLSKPDDVWLHARGAGGAHVLLSLGKGEELPQEALLDAAHLALHHSNLKGEPRGEVTYTRARYVRKPRGSAPGLVTVTRDKTFWVRIEAKRLDRLLSGEV